MKASEFITEAVRQRLDPKCWKGKHKEGTKIKGGVRVNNCVPNESQELDEIDRRGFLKGLGAAAVAGAAGYKMGQGSAPEAKKKYFKNIIVISHIDGVKDVADNIIDVTKREKDSFVICDPHNTRNLNEKL